MGLNTTARIAKIALRELAQSLPTANNAHLESLLAVVHNLLMELIGGEEYLERHQIDHKDTGAISAAAAAECSIRDIRRTIAFLKANHFALQELSRSFPHQVLHVLEPGSGPLAPLTIPFTQLFTREQLRITAIDIDPVSVKCLRRIAEALGIDDQLEVVQADITEYQSAEENRPHLIAMETMDASLLHENQALHMVYLLEQLREGGYFLPQKILVEAFLKKINTVGKPVIRHSLGIVCELTREQLQQLLKDLPHPLNRRGVQNRLKVEWSGKIPDRLMGEWRFGLATSLVVLAGEFDGKTVNIQLDQTDAVGNTRQSITRDRMGPTLWSQDAGETVSVTYPLGGDRIQATFGNESLLFA